ncbi:isochorismatase family cysteine hydrolase [Nonomuraea roseoviolacea]|uniref:Nicotinamidase-related amidase n=1 Tax=Nonomuraea roseoviolacea subsp. carminata TaxID=160689 RepID=A0ABT1K9C6_9ACTN|nr:isochorismatase family cysteine hydrolase [Nonomuraea roseoviolacea]MCP2350576.1 nicotinamidase-related amidase [Nonomuraea roseoviolacea subsp. carminata]
MSTALDRSVLVVVDVQNAFVRPASAHVVPVIADLVERWQGDVLFSRYINYPGSPFERLVRWSACMTSPEIDIVDELQPHTARALVIDKRGYGLFADPAGAALVAERGWRDIYVCGIATESCVLATALGAFEADLTPWLIADASASHAGPDVHDAGLLVARRFIGQGQIISVADIPASLAAPRLPCDA